MLTFFTRNATGLPFSPPKDLRAVKLNASSKDAREIMREGLCHKVRWLTSPLAFGLSRAETDNWPHTRAPPAPVAAARSQCDKWIPLDSTKNLEALVPELFWFKVRFGPR